jgi:hypothetical protein
MFEYVKLTPDEMALAYEIGKDVIETEMKNNHTGNNKLSKYAGYVGQVAAMKYLKAVNVDDYEYDLERNGKRIEVKTKVRKVLPHKDFAACVYASNADQLCDLYVFVQVLKQWENPKKLAHGAYILGWINRERYNDCFYQVKKGDFDGDYEEPADAYKIRLGDLRPIEELK